jgi:hypothetical protein
MMTDEQRAYELEHNEPVWCYHHVLRFFARAIINACAIVGMEEGNLEKLVDWFSKRTKYLKVGKLRYDWRAFDYVNKLRLEAITKNE